MILEQNIENKLVSIIIPVYNTSKEFLEECLYSVLEQTYEDIEILLIDDGSKKEIKNYLDIWGGGIVRFGFYIKIMVELVLRGIMDLLTPTANIFVSLMQMI